jgi:hypothetical protein
VRNAKPTTPPPLGAEVTSRGVRGQPVTLTLWGPVWHNRLPIPLGRIRYRDNMKNGLYSIHVSLQDGRSGKGSGVVVFRDGKILGGDAYLFYIGTYTAKGDTFKGEVLIQRHTSSPDENPLFGGPSPVGVGVSGTFTDTAAVMNGTALVGKASQIFKATLRKLAESD